MQGFVRRGALVGVALLSVTVIAACGSSGGAAGGTAGSHRSAAAVGHSAGSHGPGAVPVAVRRVGDAARALAVADKALDSQLQALMQKLRLPRAATVPAPKPLRKGRGGGAPELTLSPYARCVANAGGDTAKRQACASLSNR